MIPISIVNSLVLTSPTTGNSLSYAGGMSSVPTGHSGLYQLEFIMEDCETLEQWKFTIYTQKVNEG